MTTTPSSKRRARRFLQFSLRSLLVFVLLVSIGMSWLGVKLERARRQREAAEAIRGLGMEVSYDHNYHPSCTGPSAPKWARAIFGDDFFSDVVSVDMLHMGFDDEADVTDAVFEHLEGLTNLQAWFIRSRHVWNC